MRKTITILLFIHLYSGISAQDFIVLSDSTDIPQLEINEAYVSASKDNLKLKEMPVSVSFLTEKRLNANQVLALPDISVTVPNFFMPDYGSKLTSPVYIRGIGSRINAPSVGLYVDQVPYFEKAAFNFDFFDIERVEVLRGPQGTLYGRNTMGGIVNIQTKSPFEHHGTDLKISAGTYNAYQINANHYNDINQKLGYSISANYINNAGYYHNDFLNNMADDLNSLGLRNKLIWKISEKATLKNIASFESSKQCGYPYAQYDSLQAKSLPVNYNQSSSYNRDMFSNAMIFEYTGSKVDVVSTTSYQLLDDLQKIDQDFTADSMLFANQDQVQNLLSQEIIVRSSNQSKYKWLFGGYGFMQLFDKRVDVDIYSANMKVIKQYDHTIYGGAIFHQSTIHDLLIENLSVTAGLRLDFENDTEDYLYDRSIGGNFSNIEDTSGTLESFVVLPKVAFNYKTANGNIYATVAKGYKTGGFNSTFDDNRPQDRTFDPEYSWSYEVGLKTALLNKQIYADMALFYIDWENQQIYQTNPSGYGSRLTNAGETVSKGMELSLQAVPICGYNLSVGYGYTHATFIKYVVNEQTNYNGSFLPYIPRNTLSAQLNKAWYLKDFQWLDEIRLNLLYKGLGKIYWNEENTASQSFYSVINAKLSFVKNNIQFDLWGRNLLNNDYHAFYFTVYDNDFVQTGRPVNFGIDLKIKF
ncbi:MAG: TonB-dependent receptor [Bacteroidales bacterium]